MWYLTVPLKARGQHVHMRCFRNSYLAVCIWVTIRTLALFRGRVEVVIEPLRTLLYFTLLEEWEGPWALFAIKIVAHSCVACLSSTIAAIGCRIKFVKNTPMKEVVESSMHGRMWVFSDPQILKMKICHQPRLNWELILTTIDKEKD